MCEYWFSQSILFSLFCSVLLQLYHLNRVVGSLLILFFNVSLFLSNFPLLFLYSCWHLLLDSCCPSFLFVLHYFVLQEMAVYMAIASHKRCAFEIHKNCIKYHHLNVRINVSVMHKLERGKKNERETCLPPSPRLCLFSPFFFSISELFFIVVVACYYQICFRLLLCVVHIFVKLQPIYLLDSFFLFCMIFSF